MPDRQEIIGKIVKNSTLRNEDEVVSFRRAVDQLADLFPLSVEEVADCFSVLDDNTENFHDLWTLIHCIEYKWQTSVDTYVDAFLKSADKVASTAQDWGFILVRRMINQPETLRLLEQSLERGEYSAGLGRILSAIKLDEELPDTERVPSSRLLALLQATDSSNTCKESCD